MNLSTKEIVLPEQEPNNEQNADNAHVSPSIANASVSGSFFDHEGNILKEGDVFEYSRKKWKSKARIVKRNEILGVLVCERDVADKFVPLEKYLDKCYVIKV